MSGEKMKLGLLITSIDNVGQNGFYNAQEIGLAKELDKLFTKVIVYKLVTKKEKPKIKSIDSCNNTILKTLPSNHLGINGFVNFKQLDSDLDVLIYFSDTQLSVPSVYKWAKRNKVHFLPYIGAVKSHSTKKTKRIIMNFLFKRNVDIFQKCHCLAKTPMVKKELGEFGVNKITVAPVGLDLNLVKSNYAKYDISKLKQKYGYHYNEKIILFIGRLVEEKQPERMVEIFAELYKHNKNYRLLMIGTGELKDKTVLAGEIYGVEKVIRLCDRVPNSEIWELYRIADVFVNLNQQEIFGMAILEAMYYECKVVAWEAPGPNLIVENNTSGFLVNSNQDVVDKILNEKDIKKAAHLRIVENFTWESTALQIKTICRSGASI
jgi:1,2-diacylglycerol 3-alpha-glucosyltransferase